MIFPLAALSLGSSTLSLLMLNPNWTTAWDFLRYYWIIGLILAAIWEASFRDWTERKVFHWLSILLHGTALSLGLLLLLLFAYAAMYKDEAQLLQAYQQAALRLGLLGFFNSIFLFLLKKRVESSTK